MNEADYYKIFRDYGIIYNPLPQNYDPDSYGKQLMMTCQSNEGVLYSSFTSPTRTIIQEEKADK